MNRQELLRYIVVGVDADGHADHAVRAAMELGSRLAIDVELVHAVTVPDYELIGFDPVRAREMSEMITSRARTAVDAHARALRAGDRRLQPANRAPAHGGSVSAVANADLVRVVPGPAARVLAEATARPGGLLMLGSHKRRGLLEIGSTARAVLAKTRAGVWVQKQPMRAITTILAPVDFSEHSVRSLSTACALARALGARVRVAHCFDTAPWLVEWLGYGGQTAMDEIRDAVQAKFDRMVRAYEWKGLEHSSEFCEGEPIATILDLSKRADLLVMGTHGRTGLVSSMLGGVAYAMVRRAELPVLAVPDPGRPLAG